MVTENGGNVPQRAAIGSEVEYMLVAVAVVGVNAELSGRMCGEVLDETSVSVGFGTAIDFALHRPDWWARLVEARRVDTQRAHPGRARLRHRVGRPRRRARRGGGIVVKQEEAAWLEALQRRAARGQTQ